MIKVHVIAGESDRAMVEAINGLKDIKVVQWDYSFDTAYQWTIHNESSEIDVFLANEYAHVSIVGDDGKQTRRDAALLKRIRDLYLLRPKVKFVLLCDEDRELPENRHFLSRLVSMGIYDFHAKTEFNVEWLEQIIREPKRTIAHVQAYMAEAENVRAESVPAPFQKKPKEELKAVDIFASIMKRRKEGEGEKEKKKPKIKHIIEKVRPSVVTFRAVGSCSGDSSLLAQAFAVMLAGKGAKVALVELDGSGVPRIGFSTNIKSARKTVEAALQRIEDEEDISGLLVNPKEAIESTPGYDSAIVSKLKSLPETLHVLAVKESAMPDRHPLRNFKASTLDDAPGEMVNQLIFRQGYDAVVFALSGDLYNKIVFQALKVSNYIYCVTDQHPGHISWLRQTLRVMEEIGIPRDNIRTVIFPSYDLVNIRPADIDAAVGMEVDHHLPDVKKDLLELAWGEGRIHNEAFNLQVAEMIRESTGYRLSELDKKAGRRFSLSFGKAGRQEQKAKRRFSLPFKKDKAAEEK